MSRRGKKPYLSVRMPVEELELLHKIARERGEDLSSFVRRAIYIELDRLGLLPMERKRALGLGSGSVSEAKESGKDANQGRRDPSGLYRL